MLIPILVELSVHVRDRSCRVNMSRHYQAKHCRYTMHWLKSIEAFLNYTFHKLQEAIAMFQRGSHRADETRGMTGGNLR